MSWKQKFATTLIATGLIGVIVGLWITPDKSDFYVFAEIESESGKYFFASVDAKDLRVKQDVVCHGVDGENTYLVIFYGKPLTSLGTFSFVISIYGPESRGFPSMMGDMSEPSKSNPAKSVMLSAFKPVSFMANLMTFSDKKVRDDMLSYNMAASKERGSLLDCIHD